MVQINNVLLFVSDSLRWDSFDGDGLPDGELFKTVAQSSHSPTSFATLATGLYPREHGVLNWGESIPPHIERLFDASKVETAFYQSEQPDPIFDTLREDPNPLSDMESPFFYMERDVTTHAPYGTSVNDQTVESYFHSSRSRQKILSEYRDAVESSKQKFLTRINQLRNRGELDSTLLIFTGDHGELLGEYGDFGHNTPVSPELIYVPTFISHPSFTTDEYAVDPETEIIEHVDVAESINQVLDLDLSTSGHNFLSSDREHDYGISHMNIKHNNTSLYASDGVWWREGGHMFLTSNIINRMKYIAYAFLRSPTRNWTRRSPFMTARAYLINNHSFGSPPVSRSQANQYISDHHASTMEVDSDNLELDGTTEERLKDMGYL